MEEPLNVCLEKLAKLHTHRNKTNWTAATFFQDPGKPLLLLSVIDMAAGGFIRENLVEPSFELAGIYNRYWKTVTSAGAAPDLAAAFMALEDEGFWKMTGLKETAVRLPIDTMGKLHKSYLGATIDPEISPLLTEQHARKTMRETLISTYFANKIQSALLDVALINHGAAIYRKELLNDALAPTIKTGRGDAIKRKISSLGFATAIVDIYDHRCAICGIKLMTPEGHSAVDATRIIPRQLGGDDHPSNGLALCKICGWSFANGLLGIGEEYEVTIPIAVRLNGNLPGHILIFKGRTIAKPKQEAFIPSRKNLAWHRQNVLRE
ncbi:MAG: hypothetical protein P1P81_00835 [Desulfobulbales bacterium]|nr:hypothetical protein [Desulfobulbales bacterium]